VLFLTGVYQYPPIVCSLKHFEIAGAPAALHDDFLVDRRDRLNGVEESLEEGKLVDAGKMDQRTGIGDDNYVLSCETVSLNAVNSSFSQPASYSAAGTLCSDIKPMKSRRGMPNSSAPLRQEIRCMRTQSSTAACLTSSATSDWFFATMASSG